MIAHTVVSHVAEPRRVLEETRRLLTDDGMAIIFDGDYASLVGHTGDAEEDVAMADAVKAAVVGNPYIMRDLPGLFPDFGFRLDNALGDLLVEIGDATYFGGLFQTYVPMAPRAGAIDQARADAWLGSFKRACDARRFFGACSFVTYIVQPDGRQHQ